MCQHVQTFSISAWSRTCYTEKAEQAQQHEQSIQQLQEQLVELKAAHADSTDETLKAKYSDQITRCEQTLAKQMAEQNSTKE